MMEDALKVPRGSDHGRVAEARTGKKTAELCRRHGISDATFCNWKAKYGAMTVPEAARLRTLGDESRLLTTLSAESMLDVSALRSDEQNLGRTDIRHLERRGRQKALRHPGLVPGATVPQTQIHRSCGTVDAGTHPA
jgi:putative transposase